MVKYANISQASMELSAELEVIGQYPPGDVSQTCRDLCQREEGEEQLNIVCAVVVRD